MTTIHEKAEKEFKAENGFEIFKHNNLLCCVQRMNWSGNLNGYVAVAEGHPLYGKDYGDMVIVENVSDVEFNGNYIGLLTKALDTLPENMLSLDLAINVHGGLTYSRDSLQGIDESVFGKLWWFGFDTAHSGDLRPYQTDIDRKYGMGDYGETYKNFEYVKKETQSLAEQLSKYNTTP